MFVTRGKIILQGVFSIDELLKNLSTYPRAEVLLVIMKQYYKVDREIVYAGLMVLKHRGATEVVTDRFINICSDIVRLIERKVV